MSKMYPTSSHQLVAAAFRRARKKFPTNFGQLPWPLQYERKDSKSEQLQSTTTCKRCEERFTSSEIRNVKSSNVWPRFTSSWSTDPRGTRSLRENNALPRRRKVGRTNCGGCDCRRICRSSNRNVVVSFSEEGKSNSRCSGGDVAEGRSSIETISSRSFRSRVRRQDCGSIERVDDEATVQETRRKNEMKSKTKNRSSIHGNECSQNLAKIDRLNLLYDRSNDRTKNSVSFYFNRTETDVNNSTELEAEDEEEALDFPSELHEWENRTREVKMGRGNRPRQVTADGIIVNCSCDGKNGLLRNENYRRHRNHSQMPRFERDRHESSLRRDLLPRPEGSSASSTKETNRLCKDCARGQCSKNPSLAASVPENEDEADEQQCASRADDVCAIKHKDSMAILVEKFKNKRNLNSCSDDETIFKSDEETTPSRTRSAEMKIVPGDREESEEFESEDVACCKIHGNNATAIPEVGKFHKKPTSLKSRSGYCCSVKEGSCRHALL